MRRLLGKAFRHQTLYWIRTDLTGLAHRLKGRIAHPNPRRVKSAARFLNVGCGPHGRVSDEWLNVDLFPAPGIDYLCDASFGLPFEDARFEGMFAEHFFEHLTPDQARRFLAESKRVLKPGGVLRLSVPDGELYIRKYIEDRDWMLARRDGAGRTPMEVMNIVFRQRYEHQYTWDCETLGLWMREAGFEDVGRVGFGDGAEPALLIDQESRSFESLYMEGRAPLSTASTSAVQG